jgi:hypothetical protein
MQARPERGTCYFRAFSRESGAQARELHALNGACHATVPSTYKAALLPLCGGAGAAHMAQRENGTVQKKNKKSPPNTREASSSASSFMRSTVVKQPSRLNPNPIWDLDHLVGDSTRTVLLRTTSTSSTTTGAATARPDLVKAPLNLVWIGLIPHILAALLV